MTLLPSWVDSANQADCPFPLNNLPYGVFSTPGTAPRCGVAIGDMILDLAACEARGLIDAQGSFAQPQLNGFMALGRAVWDRTRARLIELLGPEGPRDLPLVAMDAAQMHLPIRVSEYTDFYASKNHAFNVGVLFRGPENALPPQWTHMPIGYNGRASSVVVSGTPIRRPMGQLKGDAGPIWAPCRRLDLELELGAIVGADSAMGSRVSVEEAEAMIFGYVLLNDWSARDVQAWEYQPLGPFQSKALGTTIGAWVVTQAALEPFRSAGAERVNPLLPYLAEARPGLYDLTVGWTMNGQVMGQTNYNVMYYSSAQQLAHHTSSGCPMRVGDLLGSGTISGPAPEQTGALLEMTQGGKQPVSVNGESRTFIEDGDEIGLFAWAQGAGYRIGFGPCTGRVLPAQP
ncbi:MULTISPECIES: fumarylacetoacetase [unclassified Paracoccus (in: a-proteobacteria)]|uniref:fumarylacetoacetase n=1 Tax=unclassified Paracoccus (in: a-proteobacteria) TaxID=2688777 RepID=UPI0012B2040F|nr:MULTISPECIES: fumarylacetoacetase [unclassified Paracoccus (in: a-proteobacteria)]UXU76689.1 fumarylacetoacetase [Paracoccus sp. SMMA_5]UXU82530.1 fumarylacetoacetase [Paracoccus sp. SMMA_5_TC]